MDYMFIILGGIVNLLDIFINTLYPQTCGICNKLSKKPICRKCKNKLDKIIFPKRKVFLPLSGIYYDEHMYLFKYEGIIKQKIILYKFYDKSYLYKFFADIIYKNSKIMEYIKSYDIIIPVPLAKYRKRERGYNQTYLILKELAKKDNQIIIAEDVLIKMKNIKPQSTLDKKQRQYNIKNAFYVQREYKIKNKKILLFDDVFTTGSTTNECSRVLKEKNAIKVGILTIVKD